MSKEKLRESLERLRSEINILKEGNDAAKNRINRLITDLEHYVKNLDNNDQRTVLLAHIPKLIGELETEHPRITNILNAIMVTLSNMGI
jgi:predicted RNase H-like nuclease (RuvC/YqgF family)